MDAIPCDNRPRYRHTVDTALSETLRNLKKTGNHLCGRLYIINVPIYWRTRSLWVCIQSYSITLWSVCVCVCVCVQYRGAYFPTLPRLRGSPPVVWWIWTVTQSSLSIKVSNPSLASVGSSALYSLCRLVL